ncbi:TrbI/VirB10 family protein (plasmid) [Ralstonia pseudosolanacearum]
MTGIIVLAGAGMFLFDSGPATRREKPKTVSITAPGTVDDKDAWRAQQAAAEKANGSRIDEVKAQLKAQEESNKKLAAELELLKKGNSGAGASGGASSSAKADPAVLDKPLPTNGNGPGQRVLNSPAGKGGPASLNQPLNQVPEPPKRELEIITFGTSDGKGGVGGLIAGAAGGNTEVVGFPTDEKAKRFQTTKGAADGKRPSIDFIPAGSFVRVAMLNGVDAPTGGQAQSNPLPVAFQVLDAANLANKHKLDIKDCRFVAAAWGDLSSERMMGRTDTLTCIINDEAVEMAVKGQVIGEDGKAGVRGRLVTKQGQLLANALFAGTLSGIGKAIQQSSATVTTGAGGVTQTIDPDKVGRAGIGGGLGSASNMLAQYYLKAADKLFPVIETDGGRTVEILITKGAVYNGKALAKDEYRGLLKRSGLNSRSYQDD